MGYGSGSYGGFPYGGGPGPAPPSREEINNEIIAALAKASGNQAPICPVCRKRDFVVGAFVPLQTALNPLGSGSSGFGAPQVIPCVTVSCQTCGNTQLINLLFLGFDESQLRNWGYPLG
jgi:hypothetical protein